MQVSLRDLFALMFLVAIALFGSNLLYTRSSLEGQRISRKAELNGLENRVKMELLQAEASKKLSAALDRWKVPMAQAFATVHPRGDATLSILQVPTYNNHSVLNRPTLWRLHIPNSQPVFLKFVVGPAKSEGNQSRPRHPNWLAVGPFESSSILHDRIDFDPLTTLNEFNWINPNPFTDHKDAPMSTGPYAMRLPLGTCDIELRTAFPTMHLLVNGRTELDTNLLPNSRGFSASTEFAPLRTQHDYALNSPLPVLARAKFERGYAYELWLSTQPCEFTTFPGANDDQD